jgi:hypothetical protein
MQQIQYCRKASEKLYIIENDWIQQSFVAPWKLGNHLGQMSNKLRSPWTDIFVDLYRTAQTL